MSPESIDARPTSAPPRPLTIALEKVDFLAPDRVTDDTSVLTLKNLVFEPLCRWDDGAVQPALFERWSCTPDGRTWRFRLRRGATFHDGRPCTADDVLAFVDALLGAVDTFGMPWPYARYLAHARLTVEAIDCVGVASDVPIGDLPEIFSEFYPCRLDADGRPLLGTGPYRVAAFARGVDATLQRVANGATEAGPRTLRFVACASADERVRLLAAGDCDAASNLERTEAPLVFAPSLRWQRRGSTLSVMSYLDCRRGLFRSPVARQAVNRAVDVQRIVDELFGGLGLRSSTVVSPYHFGARRAGLTPIPYDPDGARRLFDQAAGEPDTGDARAVLLRTPRSMPHKADAVTATIASMLRDVGLDVRVDIEADRPAYARQVGQKHIGDSAIFDSSPHGTFRVLDDKISSAVRGTWWQGYTDVTLDEMIGRANRTIDDDARAHAYAACLGRLHRDPPWLFLFHPIDVLATRPGVTGLTLDHKGVLNVARRPTER